MCVASIHPKTPTSTGYHHLDTLQVPELNTSKVQLTLFPPRPASLPVFVTVASDILTYPCLHICLLSIILDVSSTLTLCIKLMIKTHGF